MITAPHGFSSVVFKLRIHRKIELNRLHDTELPTTCNQSSGVSWNPSSSVALSALLWMPPSTPDHPQFRLSSASQVRVLPGGQGSSAWQEVAKAMAKTTIIN